MNAGFDKPFPVFTHDQCQAKVEDLERQLAELKRQDAEKLTRLHEIYALKRHPADAIRGLGQPVPDTSELERLRRFKDSIYSRIEHLIKLDPSAGSPCSVMLCQLAELCEEWEKKEFPITQSEKDPKHGS